MIAAAEGTDLIDEDGDRFIDGHSSLWCNLHGHRHPRIDGAIRDQLDKVAHSTMLGLTHEPGVELARRLGEIAPPGLERVFYSDSGSTAVEIALKMAFQYWQQRGGQHVRRTSFVNLTEAYHGDTIGSVSVGGIDLFHSVYEPLLFGGHQVDPGDVDALAAILDFHDEEIAAVIVEPLVQGAAGILPAAARLPARGAGALRLPRRAADLRRGRDRLRPHRHDVRLRAGARRARLPLPRQGPDERLHAARGDADDGAHLRGLPRRAPGLPHLLPRPHVHRQPARLRGGDRQPRGLRGGVDAAAAAAEDPAPARHPRARSPRWTRWPRSAVAASWSGSTSASTIPRCGSATG